MTIAPDPRARYTPLLTGCLLAVLTLLSSCSSVPGDEQSRTSGPPFSRFLDADLAAVHYASVVITANCLADAGFPQLRDSQKIPTKQVFERNLRLDETTFGARTEDEARTRGFGFDRAHDEPPIVRSTDPEYRRLDESCRQESWDRIGDDSRAIYDAYFQLGNQLVEAQFEVLSSEKTRPFYEELLTCLDSKGYRPDQREEYLKDHKLSRFGVEFGGYAIAEEDGIPAEPAPGAVEVLAPPVQHYRPTEAETVLAVAYFQCRQATRFTERMIRIGLDAQEQIVRDREGQFLELNPKLRALAKDAASRSGR